jgi:hypothetical protein
MFEGHCVKHHHWIFYCKDDAFMQPNVLYIAQTASSGEQTVPGPTRSHVVS